MKTIEQILKKQNISRESLMSAEDNGADLLEAFGKSCMTHALIAASEKATRLEDHQAILALIDEIK